MRREGFGYFLRSPTILGRLCLRPFCLGRIRVKGIEGVTTTNNQNNRKLSIFRAIVDCNLISSRTKPANWLAYEWRKKRKNTKWSKYGPIKIHVLLVFAFGCGHFCYTTFFSFLYSVIKVWFLCQPAQRHMRVLESLLHLYKRLRSNFLLNTKPRGIGVRLSFLFHYRRRCETVPSFPRIQQCSCWPCPYLWHMCLRHKHL